MPQVTFTDISLSDATFISISTNFKASRRWRSPTCSQNCASIESLLRPLINFCISWRLRSGTPGVGPEDASYVVREFQSVFEQDGYNKLGELPHLPEAIDRRHAQLALQRTNAAKLGVAEVCELSYVPIRDRRYDDYRSDS